MIDENDDSSISCISDMESVKYSFDNTYTLLDEIPSAGYNRLMRAERYGKQFVLKGLKAEYQMRPQYVALLQKEFEIALSLSHPNIARIYAYEQIPPLGPCIVMEYVDGRPLDRFLQERPSAALRQRVTRQLLDAMAYYHSLQVVHRDLKPSNILVTNNGNNVRIIDFGCSDADQYLALKQPSYMLAYASPEQIEGAPLDCRSDIYNFGRVLQQIFPHRYRAVKRRCCRHSREARYANADAVRSALFGFRRWGGYAALLLVLICAIFAVHEIRHFNSREFSYPLNDDIVLRCKIEDSQAVVLRTEKSAGRLVLPETIRYRGLGFPLATIASGAFAHCDSITHVTLPENLRHLGDSAFFHCVGIADTLTLPIGLETIGQLAFAYCENITTLVVRSANLYADVNGRQSSRFLHCDRLRAAYFESTVERMCPYLLDYAYLGLEEVYVSEGIDYIGNHSLSETYSLRTLHLPNSLRRLEPDALYGTGLYRLVLPDSLEEVGNMALGELYQCKYIEMGSCLRHLDSRSFYDLKVIDTLIFHAVVPPAYSGNPFDCFASDKPGKKAVFLVPAQSLEAYRADSAYARLNPQPLKE